MNTHQTFLTEQLLLEHSKAQTLRLAHWVGADPDRLAALLDIALGPNYRLNQRSAWVLMYVGQYHPQLLEPWLPRMVAKAGEPGVHDAVKRNVVRILEDVDIPEALLGDLADLCFRFLADPQEAVAIRAFSMTVLDKICEQVPELRPELRLLIEEHLPHASAAFRSRGRKILRK
ncbi:MAG: hypothetical protein IT260_13585 [Saprospiraceae bacterium]|nr:hypothetical protein [Saprospiraceae bacterium]